MASGTPESYKKEAEAQAIAFLKDEANRDLAKTETVKPHKSRGQTLVILIFRLG